MPPPYSDTARTVGETAEQAYNRWLPDAIINMQNVGTLTKDAFMAGYTANPSHESNERKIAALAVALEKTLNLAAANMLKHEDYVEARVALQSAHPSP